MNARISPILAQWRRAPELLASMRETSDALKLALGYLGIRSPSYPFVVHFRTGEELRVETHHDLVTLWIIFFRKEYRVPATCTTIVPARIAALSPCMLHAALLTPLSMPSSRSRRLRRA